MDEPTQELVNFDGVTWRRVQMPSPKKKYYSRVDVLEGGQPASDANGFVMVAGGRVWPWESTTNTWNSVPQPALERTLREATQQRRNPDSIFIIAIGDRISGAWGGSPNVAVWLRASQSCHSPPASHAGIRKRSVASTGRVDRPAYVSGYRSTECPLAPIRQE